MNFLFLFLSTAISSVFGFLRYKYTYWEFRGVKQLKTNFLFGNILKIRTVHMSELMHEVYKKFHSQVKIAGAYIFTKPIAVVLDLDVVKAVLIKDFQKLTDRDGYHNEDKDPLSQNLFHLTGEKWRKLRTKLTPTFTSGKMKFMFPTIVGVAKELEQAFVDLIVGSQDGVVELHDMMGRYTTDVIGKCVFGLECNSLNDPDVEFRRIGREIFYTRPFRILWRLFKITYINIIKHFGFTRFADGNLTRFIMRVVHDTVTAREQQNIQRNDFINILLELKKSKDPDSGLPGLTIEEVAAQVFVFFVAGFETSSSNMSYGLFELAKNPEVQERVRKEVVEVLERHDGNFTFEAMTEMRYLDQVITETVRKYPALSALTRIAKEDYEVPGTKVVIEKDTKVYIPVTEIHYDPDIYANPHQFNPDRFSPAQVKLRHPQSFLGFGDGPRNCIGLRFGRMQVAVGLATLLKSFKFSVSEKTADKLEISKFNTILVPAGGVWVRAEKLEEAVS